MRPIHSLALWALLAVAAPAPPLGAIMGSEPAPAATADGDDFAAGVAAFDRQDWPAVIDHMAKVIAARPWDDEAHNLSGFAYRKLGDYDRALELYDQALTLNPHNRGALEYLGEAYLELARPDDARALLARLVVACHQVSAAAPAGAGNVDGAPTDCEEWADLNEAIEAYDAGNPEAGAAK